MLIESRGSQCGAKRKDGTPCKGPDIGRGYCFAHDPELSQKRDEVRAKGGRNKANAIRLHRLTPPRLTPVYDKLEQALNEVHSGTLSPQQATAMASLGRALTAILTSGELEERVRNLEQARKEGLRDGFERANRGLGE